MIATKMASATTIATGPLLLPKRAKITGTVTSKTRSQSPLF